MSTFFISDTHWNHRNIIKYSNRPFKDIQEMNEILIDNWNRNVRPEDNIWHLGDFAFMKVEQIQQLLPRLNGYKMFIAGNHDQEIMKNQEMLLGRNLFTSIGRYAEFNHNNQFFVLFHYGQRVWNKSHHGSIQLHGHSHGSLPPYGKSVDIGVDAPFVIPRFTYMEATLEQELKRRQEDYRPINIDEVIEYMKDRDITKPDHHNIRY